MYLIIDGDAMFEFRSQHPPTREKNEMLADAGMRSFLMIEERWPLITCRHERMQRHSDK